MSEREFDVRPIGLDFVCDTCMMGVMKYGGVMKMCDPPKFEHKCINCEFVRDLDKKYPTVEFRDCRQPTPPNKE